MVLGPRPVLLCGCGWNDMIGPAIIPGLNVSVQPLGNSRAVFCGKFLDMGSDESKNRLGNCSLLGWAAQYISSKSCYELKKGNTNQPYSRTN